MVYISTIYMQNAMSYIPVRTIPDKTLDLQDGTYSLNFFDEA